MHLYAMTRGHKPHVDQFINELMGKYLPHKWSDGDHYSGIGVRPIQLWEIVYPKEFHNALCTDFFGNNKIMTQHKKHYKWLALIRKALGIEKVDYEVTDQRIPMYKEHVEIIGVGQKQDAALKTKGVIQLDDEGKEIEGL